VGSSSGFEEDERLPSHAESTGFLIDLAQQFQREVDMYALNRPAGADGLAEIHMSRQVNAGVVHGIEFGGRECPRLGGTLLLLHRALA
jgi:hypothetical protein